MHYIAYLHKEAKSSFGVSFPDFPGCVTAARTLEEASRKAVKALSFHIVGMVEDGDAIPEPSALDVLVKDPAQKGAVVMLVDVDTDATVRFNVSAPASQLKKIDHKAEVAGVSRSAYLVQSALGQRA